MTRRNLGFMKKPLVLLAAIVVFSVAWTGVASAAQLKVNGSSDIGCTLGTAVTCALTNGTATGTPVGPSTFVGSLSIPALPSPACNVGTVAASGSLVLTTDKKGDSLFMTLAAQVCTAGGAATATGTYHITSGTGRYVNAQGSGSYSSVSDFTTVDQSGAFGTYRFTVKGTLG